MQHGERVVGYDGWEREGLEWEGIRIEQGELLGFSWAAGFALCVVVLWRGWFGGSCILCSGAVGLSLGGLIHRSTNIVIRVCGFGSFRKIVYWAAVSSFYFGHIEKVGR